MRTLTIIASLAFVAALVAGCGDSANSSTDATKTAQSGGVTRASYIEEADTTCAEQNRRLQRKIVAYMRRNAGIDPVKLDAAMVDKVFAPDFEFEIRSIRAIVLPPQDASRIARLLNAMLAVVAEAEKDPAAFVRTDGAFAKPEAMATAYGFASCGGFNLQPG